MSLIRSVRNHLPQLIVAVLLLSIYSCTLAPGLTWANGGSDGGDLITAAATGGIPHPTGYPLYLLLARFFQFLPIGSLAFRTNLLSAVSMALAAAIVSRLVVHSVQPSRNSLGWSAGMAAGFAFGLAPLIWSQAVITEVYAIQAFLTVLILYIYAGPMPVFGVDKRRLDCWRGLLLGLAMGNHVTTLLLVPAALLLGSVHHSLKPDGSPSHNHSWYRNRKFDSTSLRRQIIWFGTGLSLYLILPLRALAHPPVNWGNVVTPERLWWLVSGQLYQSYFLHFSMHDIWGRIQASAALLLQQFGLLGIVLGLLGLIVYGTRSQLHILTIWTAVTAIVFATFYGSNDSYVLLIPAYLSFAVWVGLGIIGLANQLNQRYPFPRICLGLFLIGYFLVRSATHWSQVDAMKDLRAESFGREILLTAPQNAIIFAKGDQAVFALWYFQFALGERPDLVVLATDLLHFDWYQENVHSTYPALVIPSPFPWPESIMSVNPSRATCYVQYVNQTQIKCTEPLTYP